MKRKSRARQLAFRATCNVHVLRYIGRFECRMTGEDAAIDLIWQVRKRQLWARLIYTLRVQVSDSLRSGPTPQPFNEKMWSDASGIYRPDGFFLCLVGRWHANLSKLSTLNRGFRLIRRLKRLPRTSN